MHALHILKFSVPSLRLWLISDQKAFSLGLNPALLVQSSLSVLVSKY